MDGKILSIMFTASTAVALVTTTPAQAQTACPERLELLKQFADGGTLDDVSKEQIDEMALEAMENEEACERTVAELERRLKVEVREDEVVRIGGEDEGDLAATATDEGGIGVEGPPAEDAEETLAAGDEQTMSDDQSDQQGMSEDQSMAAAGDQDGEPTIGGGLDIPRDEIDTKYGPLAWATFDEVIGADVVSAKGEPVGEIVALVRERPMGDFFAVLSDGGDQVIVPIKAFEIAEDDRIAMVGGEEDLEGMPEYDPERYEEVRE